MLQSAQSGHRTSRTLSLYFGWEADCTITEQLPIHARGNALGIFPLAMLKEICNIYSLNIVLGLNTLGVLVKDFY